MKKKFGGAIIDVGNVVIDHSKTTIQLVTDALSKPELYYAIPEVEEVMDGLAGLNRLFGGNVTLLYKATDTVDWLIIGWMTYHQLTEKTGIPLSRVVRINDKSDMRDKTSHIDQSSETHERTYLVIDDRVQVIRQFIGKVPQLFLFRPQSRGIA